MREFEIGKVYRDRDGGSIIECLYFKDDNVYFRELGTKVWYWEDKEKRIFGVSKVIIRYYTEYERYNTPLWKAMNG